VGPYRDEALVREKASNELCWPNVISRREATRIGDEQNRAFCSAEEALSDRAIQLAIEGL
jgi:hypothetical protein